MHTPERQQRHEAVDGHGAARERVRRPPLAGRADEVAAVGARAAPLAHKVRRVRGGSDPLDEPARVRQVRVHVQLRGEDLCAYMRDAHMPYA